jgi:hypothetical protein
MEASSAWLNYGSITLLKAFIGFRGRILQVRLHTLSVERSRQTRRPTFRIGPEIALALSSAADRGDAGSPYTRRKQWSFREGG